MMNGAGGQNAQLASLLRECANYVERNEFHLYCVEALQELTLYVKEHSSKSKPSSSTTPSQTTNANRPSVEKSIGNNDSFDAPDDEKASSTRGGNKVDTDTSRALPEETAFPAEISADFKPRSGKEEQKHKEKEGVFGFGLGKKISNKLEKGFEKMGLGSEVSGHKDSDTEAAAKRHTHSSEDFTPATGSTVQPTKVAAKSTETSSSKPSKPAFQRPVNPNSTLIANGWIEQQRRSKMRYVWKDILASLVEGRKPGEETTLWIQRQVTNPTTGKASLEALHQIPMKWLENVSSVGIDSVNNTEGEHQFTIKVFNITDEFLFRCPDAESAQNWVLTLRSVSESEQKKSNKKQSGPQATDVGLDNLDDWGEEEKKSNATSSPAGPKPYPPPPEQQSSSTGPKMTIRELRAVAHGAGYNTSGMERPELESLVAKIAEEERKVQSRKDAAVEEQRRQQEEMAEAKRSMIELEMRRKQQEEEQRRMQEQHDMELKRRQEEEQRWRQQEEHRRRLSEQQAAEQRAAAAEEQRRRLAEQQAAAARQSDEERAKHQQWQQAQWQAQQAAQTAAQREQWQKKWEAEQAARQQQANQYGNQQQQQQQQQQQYGAQQYHHQAAQQPIPPVPPPPQVPPYNGAGTPAAAPAGYPYQQQQQQQQQQQYHSQHQQQQQSSPPQQQQQGAYGGHPGQYPGQHAQHPGQHQQYAQQQQQPIPPPPPPPPPPQQQAPPSPVNMKYARMADQESDDGLAAQTDIKRNLLINWALQPPMMQMLRPIHILVSSIHTVFPPAFGVAGHDYFSKWTPIAHDSLLMSPAMANNPDEEKLKKAVKKIRFFLHPDKLPRDLNDDQSFVCKMVWDITSDAWEEFEKRKEELGWIHN